jgi:hypothetical protein
LAPCQCVVSRDARNTAVDKVVVSRESPQSHGDRKTGAKDPRNWKVATTHY